MDSAREAATATGMWARHGLRRLSGAVVPACHASTLVIGEHSAGALAAGTYHAIGAANQLGGDVRVDLARPGVPVPCL